MIRTAGSELLHYNAALWALQDLKSRLPKYSSLDRKSIFSLTGQEFELPRIDKLPLQNPEAFFLSNLQEAGKHLDTELEAKGRFLEQVMDRYQERLRFLSQEVIGDWQQVLRWFRGKDLYVQIFQEAPAAANQRGLAVRWIQKNPKVALDLLPEWRLFISKLFQA